MAEPDPRAHAERIEDIARRLDRLTISRRDPDAFFEERSELVEALRREAMTVRTHAGRAGAATTARVRRAASRRRPITTAARLRAMIVSGR